MRRKTSVFAPTDDAFAALPEGTVESLLLPGIGPAFAILTCMLCLQPLWQAVSRGRDHGRYPGSEDPIKVTLMGGSVMVDGANVIAADIEIANGVIHVIDSVILPDGE